MDKKEERILPNGAKVLKSKDTKPHHEIVLCVWKDSEYVTWILDKNTQGCVHGHYFRDYENALTDYVIRE